MSASLPYLQFETTTRCNYTCGFCAGRHMQQTDIALEKFTQLVDSITDLQHIELQGEGEPLLHPDFFAMIAHARARFPQVKISFITNGSLFTTDNIARILQSSVNSILVSIESADDEEFQEIRGGKLSRVKRGIMELMTQKQRVQSPLTLGFAVTVLKQTVGQINSIGRLYRELAMDGGIVIQPLQAMDCYSQFYNEAMRSNIPNRADHGLLNQLIATDAPLQQALMAFGKTRNFYRDLYTSVNPHIPTCAWLENGLYVSADGVANSCCYIKDSSQHGFATLDNNLATILEQRQSLLNRLKNAEIPTQCRSCGIARRMQQAFQPDQQPHPSGR